MSVLLSLLSSKFVLYGGLAIFIFGVAFTALKVHDHNTRAFALLQYNQKQLEQVITDNKLFLEQQSKLNEDQLRIIHELEDQNKQLDAKLADLNVYLSSQQAQRDNRSSSPVLRNTIRILGGQK